MYVKNRFRPGRPYFYVEWKDSRLQIDHPPEIWLCESGTSRNCRTDSSHRCGDGFTFARLSKGHNHRPGPDRVRFESESVAAEQLMTWNEYVECCLFTWRGAESQDDQSKIRTAESTDIPSKRVVIGLENSRYQDLLRQCTGQGINRVHVVSARSSGFATACRQIPDLLHLHLERTPISCAELDPISQALSVRMLTISDCPIVRSCLGSNHRLADDRDAESHDCSGRACLTRSIHRLAKRLTTFYCNDVKIRDQDIWGFDSSSTIEFLALAGSKITDQSSRRLGAMRKLLFANLSDSRISDETVIALCRNGQLESLNLDRTRVTDQIVDHLISAPKLHSLRIRGTNVTRDGLQRLRDERPELHMHL